MAPVRDRNTEYQAVWGGAAVLKSLLFLLGCLAWLAGTYCTFGTFATNDYRPILAAGFAFLLLSAGCFGLHNRLRS